MKRYILFVFLWFPIIIHAQYWEFGGYLGATNYNGEFSERFIKLNTTHFSYGLLTRLNVSRFISFRLSLTKGMVSGADSTARYYYHRRWTRNLSFRSPIVDIAFIPEIYLLGFRTNHFTYKSSPYLFIGICLFKMNPQANYNGKWINLQPLGTEGQFLPGYADRRYSLYQVGIPFGFGWKYSPGKNLNVGIEVSARKTFTDYLDDCSNSYASYRDILYRNGQIAASLSNRTGEVNDERIEKVPNVDMRGSPEAKDWYYFVGITLTYSLLNFGCMGF